MTTLYFKRHWDESTGDELTDSWGTSTFYFETDNEYFVIRQIQVFQNKKVLKYDNEHSENEFGMLSEIPLDIDEFREFEIDKSEFELVWQENNLSNA